MNEVVDVTPEPGAPVFDEASLQATARLIAAAPELLEACRKVARQMRYHLVNASPWGADAVDALEAAIAKAEGR